jgi:inorganic pyrophosphatase
MNSLSLLNQHVTAKIDRPMGSRHPTHHFLYPLNYGYIPGTLSGDGEEIDAYILGVFEPINEFNGICIAVIQRQDEDDDKLIIVPEGVFYSSEQIKALTEFQERFFKSRIVVK